MTITVDNGPSLFSVKQINFKQKCYTSASLLPTSNLFLCFPLPQYISTGIQCEDPGKLTMRNGNITSYETNFFYGATLLFECNEGYELKGSETVSCLENGWIPRRWPYCSSKCIWWNPAEAFNRTGRKYHVIQNKKKFMEGGFWPSSLSPISFHHFPCFCFVLFCFVFFVFFFFTFFCLRLTYLPWELFLGHLNCSLDDVEYAISFIILNF